MGSAQYPTYWETDVVLRDGSTVHVRPVRPGDDQRLLTFFRNLSKTSRAFRFFSATSDIFLMREARREAVVDYVRTFGLLATTGSDERIVGHALYAGLDGDRAELSIAVADDYQGRGVGTILLGQPAEIAATNGIRVLEADVLPDNHRMLEVLRE